MQKTIFLVITISILFFSVHSEAAGVKESRTWSSGNSLLLSKMSIMQSTQPADYTNNGDNIQSSRSNMRWDATFEEGVNMGWDATFEEGVNVELLSYSSTCTCMCICDRCSVKSTCYQPESCGGCDSLCGRVCRNHNCGELVRAYGDCP